MLGYLKHLFSTWKHFALLGFCLPQIWMYVIVQQANPLPFPAEITFHSALGITALLGAILYYVKPKFKAPMGIGIACAITLCVLPLYIMVVPASGFYEPLTVALCLASGIACGWYFLFWVSLVVHMGLKDAICYLLLSFALAAASRMLFALIPDTVSIMLLIFVAISFIPVEKIARGLSFQTEKAQEFSFLWNKERQEKDSSISGLRQLAPIFLEFACYGIVLGVLRGMSSETQSDASFVVLNYCLRIVVALLFFAWFGLYEKRNSTARVAQIALFVLIIVFFAFVLLGEKTFPIVTTLISFARGVVLMLLTITTIEMAKRLRVNPVVMFGIGRGIYELTTILGMILDDQAITIVNLNDASLNIILFVIVCFMLVIVNRTMKVMKTFDQETLLSEHFESDPLLSIDARCKALAQEHSLTEREAEVCALMCKGRSKSYIAEELFISENTVRHHSKNLYQKLRIHNKQELLDLLGLK